MQLLSTYVHAPQGVTAYLALVVNFWISDRTTNYKISKNGQNLSKNNPYPKKQVCLREMFHKVNYLSLEKVILMDKFANHYKMVF